MRLHNEIVRIFLLTDFLLHCKLLVIKKILKRRNLMKTSQFLVLQTDFGLKDGAVSAMHGVAHMVASYVIVSDLTHEIPPYDIWAVSYRLYQTIKYWPKGTTFVSVVDPGVGFNRKSIAAKTKSGHFIITPDNGSLTHVATYMGLEEVREIDEQKNRLPYSSESNTFHGRDIYAYNGALLAEEEKSFEDLGETLDPTSVVKLPLTEASLENDHLRGSIDVLDIRFGSLWTNIPYDLIKKANIQRGDKLTVTITYQDQVYYHDTIPFVRSFADAPISDPLIYINSLVNVGIALNQASFADTYNIGTGNDWKIDLIKE